MKPPTPQILRSRAARGTLEVEHLLAAARSPSQALVDMLRALSAEHGWRSAPCLPDIPFASWAQIVILYCEEGLPAMEAALSNEARREFALALLVELGDERALETVLGATDALVEQGGEPLVFASQAAEAINLLGMRGLGQAEATAGRARRFLDVFLQRAVTDVDVGTAMCGLRYFGDEDSLIQVRSARALSPFWEAARTAAVRGIKKRSRPPAGGIGNHLVA